MKQINRRKLLKTTGAGAGIALGAGAASGNDTKVTSSDPAQPDQNVVSWVGAAANTTRIALDTDDPTNQTELALDQPLVEIPDEGGDIYDNGDLTVPGDQVQVPDLVEVFLGLDPKGIIIDILEAIDIQEDIIDGLDYEADLIQPLSDFLFKLGIPFPTVVTHTYETPGERTVTATITDENDETYQVSKTITVMEDTGDSGTDSASDGNVTPDFEADLEIRTEEPTVGEPVVFQAKNTDDDNTPIVETEWSFGDGTEQVVSESKRADALGELIGILANEFDLPGGSLLGDIIAGVLENPTPDQLKSLLNQIAGFSDGPPDEVNNMEDLLTLVTSFIDGVPTGDFEALKTFLINTVQDLNFENITSILSIEVNSNGIEGTVNPEAEGPALLIDIPLDTVTLVPSVGVEDPPVDPPEIDFDLGLTLTTGTSGELSGSIDLDTANNAATATVVDNEFTLDITEFDLLGLVEDLDLVSLIETIFDLLNIDPAEYDFDIPQFVTLVNIPSIVENAGLLEIIDGLIQDEPGRHAVEADLDMSFEDLQAVLDDVSLGPAPIPGVGEPTDKDGDGLYEDIDGDGEFTIFDVQGLFSSLDSDAVQNNPEAYNFNGDENPQEVTIFDVQGLFTKLQEKS